jgi:hypothetical protein
LDGSDFGIWNGNKGLSSNTLVPEPAIGGALLALAAWLATRMPGLRT